MARKTQCLAAFGCVQFGAIVALSATQRAARVYARRARAKPWLSGTGIGLTSAKPKCNVSRAQRACAVSAAAVSDVARPLLVTSSELFGMHHANGPHPERPERLDAALRRIRADAKLCAKLDIRDLDAFLDNSEQNHVLSHLKRVHDVEWIEDLRGACARGARGIDGDTYLTRQSFDVAILAASAWLLAADYVLDSGAPAFALTRPPGHHATPGSGMGFCLFNYAAMVAKYALDVRGVSHVAVLDFDVHHGNGTETALKSESRVSFASSHQMPLYPGTGSADFHGDFNNVLNVPLAAGTTFAGGYREIFRERLLPFLRRTGTPDLVIVSAGFDALAADPLASIELEPADYAEMTRMLLDDLGHTRVLFGLEGGYALEATASAVHYTLSALAEH